MKKEDLILDKLSMMEQKLNIMEQKLNIMDQKLGTIDNMQQEANKKLDEHDKQFEKIHEELILIEDEIHNKIPALFDNYSFHQDHLEKHDQEIKDLQAKTENHSLRLIVLEDNSNKILSS